MLDTKRLAETMVSGAKAYIDKALAGLLPRIDALEKRVPEKGEPGESGQSGKDGRDGADGIGLSDIVRDADGNLIAVMSDGRTKAIGNIAVRDGSDGKDGAPGRDGKDGRDGTDGKDGLNGKDAPAPTQEQIVDAILTMPEIIDEAVRRYLTDNPPAAGRDGKDGERGVDGKDGADGRDGVNGKDGAEGIGLAAAVQDADGNLVITDTKGGVHKLGSIRGKDGRDGTDGKDGADGLAGKDGRDGFSLENFDAELMEDGRTVLLSFSAKDATYKVELGIPAMIYRGVWKDGQPYARGDVVTFGGSTFHCNEDTSDKPEVSKTWQLMVKRGRDGKDGSPGEKGERGIEGKAGRDLTQLGLDGAKW